MFDFLPEEIDFLDKNQIEGLRDKMEDELMHMMSDKKYTIEALEEMHRDWDCARGLGSCFPEVLSRR